MANPSYMLRMNERRIIRAMMRLRTSSRVHLAKVTGMSQATVGRIVDDLMGSGIVVEQSGGGEESVSGMGMREQMQVGRPSTLIELNRKQPRYFALHVGIHTTRLAAL